MFTLFFLWLAAGVLGQQQRSFTSVCVDPSLSIVSADELTEHGRLAVKLLTWGQVKEFCLYVFILNNLHYDKFYSITISGQQMDLVNSSGTWIVTQSLLGLSWWTPIRFTRDMELKASLSPSQWHLLDPGPKFSVASWRIPGSIRTRGSPCRHSPSTLFMPDLSSLKSPPVGMIGEGCSTSMFYWVS